MIDQSHNLKPKIEETIQTAMTAQELYAKAALVDHEVLARHQDSANLIDAEECLKSAFATDVRPVIEAWRRSKGLPENPLLAYRETGYQQKIEKERREANQGAVTSYA
jgi:L-rhamnose isomerase/sugar isomerase